MTASAKFNLSALLACLGLALLWPFAGSAEEVETDPPGRVARLSYTEGAVSVAPAGSEEWAEALLNRPLTSGDRIWVEEKGRAELQIGSAAVYLDEGTGFGFVELDDDVMQMSLTEGAVTLRVRSLGEQDRIQLETPNGTVVVLEPGEYHVEVDAERDETIVKNRHGELEVLAGDERHTIDEDEQATFAGLESPTVNVVAGIGPRTGFEDWANDRERRAHESRSSQYVAREVVGYEDLDSHGDWHHEHEYGYVWVPRYVSYGWAPYRDGRWVWVSPWGWTWVDHAPWGFAPFHYGRWAYVRHRWCWVPGPRHYRAVYAPALVGWIGGPRLTVSLSYGSGGVGWFPLGPREVYVPYYRHTPRYIRQVNVSNTIIVNNTYITNVYHGRHRDLNYRYYRNPNAVSVVEREHFVSGHPVRGRLVRVSESDTRQWRHETRPPALVPERRSVLGGEVRQVRLQRDPVAFRGGARQAHTRERIPFETERRLIERNGGQPVSRSRLYVDNPKDRGDFNRERQPRSLARTTERDHAQRRSPVESSARQTQPPVHSLRSSTPSSPRESRNEIRPSTRDDDALTRGRRGEREQTLRNETPRAETPRSNHRWQPPSDRPVRSEQDRGSERIPRTFSTPAPRENPVTREHRSAPIETPREIREARVPQVESRPVQPERAPQIQRSSPPERSQSHDRGPSRSEYRSAPRSEPRSSSRGHRDSR